MNYLGANLTLPCLCHCSLRLVRQSVRNYESTPRWPLGFRVRTAIVSPLRRATRACTYEAGGQSVRARPENQG
eukprot:683944-Pleurochrysis_carterae.AAC.3